MLMGLSLTTPALTRLDRLLQLLGKWNRVYNLTAMADEETWVSHHLLDSLSIVPILPIGRLIDVGSGAGFPGLPIAVAEPNRDIVLLDSSQKKTAFLRHAAAELELHNVHVETARAEAYRPEVRFQVVVSRAFSNLPEFVRVARHLCARDGKLLAMKGVLPDEELRNLSPGYVRRVVPLTVPTLDAQRHAIFVSAPEMAAH